jgi:hypothetical protein
MTIISASLPKETQKMASAPQKITDIRVESLRASRGCAMFNMGNARYHIWFDYKTLEIEKTLFKNPPEGVSRHDRDFFDPRHLVWDNKANRPLIEHVFAVIKEQKLIEQALAKKQAEEEAKARAFEIRQHVSKYWQARMRDQTYVLPESIDEATFLEVSRALANLLGT